MKTTLLMSTIAATLMLGAIAPQSAKAEISMPITYDEGLRSLDVPDAETTVSAYGGRLRLYDVHIAKLVEVTHNSCIRSHRADGLPEENYLWGYTSNQRRTNMGTFMITCELAQSLVNTYGLGKPEATTIRFEVSSAVMGSRTEMIPILDITGEEIDEWMNFTSNFKPWQSTEHR
jgi:hypothetical protein